MSIRGSPVVVLVVEDEPLLRMTAVDLVEEAGMVALAAADAEEAVSMLEARHDVAVVFADIEMPSGMTGIHLAETIRRRWPWIGIVLTSGKVRGTEVRLPDRGVFLAKPYQPTRLLATLNALSA